jgi:hypothetical protein
VIQRRTQSPQYWGEAFIVDEADLDHIANRFLEEETPLGTDELVLEVVTLRTRQEENALQRMLSKGALYQPRNLYQPGQEIVFPALGFAVGTVVAIRPGRNPEYGPFTVITVDFEGGKRRRDFAAELGAPHKLNGDGDEAAAEGAQASGDGLLSAAELAALHGPAVRAKLEARLATQPDFVRLAGKWFLRSLLADVNPGHLNIAEAILDVNAGGPLPTEALLGDLELPAEINRNLQIFSLNYALQRDERFDEVGPSGEVLWFLRRLEPPEVLEPPRHLLPHAEPYDAGRLSADELALVRELDDEWEDARFAAPPPEGGAPTAASFYLTFPHRRAGTLPLSARLASIFPTARVAPRVRFTLVDAQSGERLPAWVVRAERYVHGLGGIYERHDIPAGAQLTVRRGDEPGTVVIDPGARRPKREWVRVASPAEQRVTFEMQKRLIGVNYDELLVLWVDSPAAIDPAWRRSRDQHQTLARVIAQVFPELAKLNAQSTVHARTLYSAVNLLLRSPVAPILARLHADAAYVAVGGNYWRFDEGAL